MNYAPVLGVVFALIGGSCAVAQPIVLWQDLTVGMSKDEVRARHPTKKVSLAEGCEAAIRPTFGRDGKLVAVTLAYGKEFVFNARAQEETRQCVKVVRDSLEARYGSPSGSDREPRRRLEGDTQTARTSNAITELAEETDPRTRDTWTLGAVTIANVRSQAIGFLTYEFVPPPTATLPTPPNVSAADKL